MTDQELRDHLNRLDMERRYKEYLESYRPKPKEPMAIKVLKAVGGVAAEGAKGAGKELTKNVLYYLGSTAVNKIAGHNIISTKAAPSKRKKKIKMTNEVIGYDTRRQTQARLGRLYRE